MTAVLDNLKEQLAPFSDAEKEAKKDWKTLFTLGCVHVDELHKASLPPRETIVSPFFKMGDLGFIHAPRGRGKTWLSMALARAISEGRSLDMWQAQKPRRVLYIDGEMDITSTQERDALLSQGEGDLKFIHHEWFYEKTGEILDMANYDQQQGMTKLCEQQGIEVMFLDNLGCLFKGIKENDADDWEKVLPWLLELRREKIAVVIVAHSGRNGEMRGTSRREDQAHWVIKLEDSRTYDETGARFITCFTKNRNATDNECPPYDWHFQKGDKLNISCRPLEDLQLFMQCIEDGFTSAKDIAEELGWSPSKVSRTAKKAKREGKIKMNGRQYSKV